MIGLARGITISGPRLARFRQARFYTQEELARVLDMTGRGVARIERSSVTQMQVKNFRKLAEVAKLSVDELVHMIGPNGANETRVTAAGEPFGAADVVQRIGDIVMWKLRAAAAKEGRAGPGEPDAERAEAFVRYAAQDLINMLAVVVPPGARRPLPDAPPALPRTTDAAGVATRKGTRSSQASAGGTSTSG